VPNTKKISAADGPVVTQILPDGSFERRAFPLPADATGTYFYEGVEMIDNRRMVLPYRTAAGFSLAVYTVGQ
jgi:hypothetical protein